MNINFTIIEQLRTLSLTTTYPKASIAAALVYRNKVISFGVNQLKTHPYQKKYGRNKDSIFWHAETNAIYTADKVLNFDKISKCTLYVVRTKWDGAGKQKLIYGNSKCCDGCMECIKDYGIKSVIYTMDEDKFGKQYGIIQL